jgi:hypothetical protein
MSQEKERMARVYKLTYFVANVKDEPGTLLKIMLELRDKNIGLSGLWGFGAKDGEGQLFLIARDSEVLREAWKDAGLLAEEGTGFFVSGQDRTGALIESLERLVEAGINIHAIDAIAVGAVFGSFIWVDASEVDRAAVALGIP